MAAVGVLLVDTSFLVDLERESRRAVVDRATRFLDQNSEQRLVICPTVAGEIASGASLSEEPIWREFLAPFRVVPITMQVSWEYGRLFRHLKESGNLIDTNDLWIAANALAHGLAVLTSNETEFRRIPGLEVCVY